jgi:hypothetical protein
MDIWDAMKRKYQGSTKVKRSQLQFLCREFEVLAMQDSESVDVYFSRTLAIANRMTSHGERVEQVMVGKIFSDQCLRNSNMSFSLLNIELY